MRGVAAGLGLAACLVLGSSVRAAEGTSTASPEVFFSQGNEAYSKGDYETAERAYQQILSRGIQNSHVYYNLANVCFRQNQIGRAILFYEKALRLDPADLDARENLKYAELRIRDRIPPDERPFLIALLERGMGLLSLEQVTRLFVLLYLLAMFLAGAWILGRGRKAATLAGIFSGALLCLALVAGGWMALQARSRNASDEAIVVTDKLEIYSGPGADNTLLASVHEGTKVTIHSHRGEWTQVTIPDGRSGWLKGEALGVI